MINYAVKLKQKHKVKKRLKPEFNLEYLSFGWYIVIPVLLFIAVGKLLTGAGVISKKLIPVFVLAGIVSMIYNLVLFIKRTTNNGRKNKH
ncbi:MAG: hypothetical protein KatS3mg091_449 [Patescibacteria group bacterium]|nr:MAG: hypothetical protein KatS3mg091_449 [Patescibacteria group bacterium]